LVPADHPLLGASVLFAANDGAVFTGRLSRARHEWLWQNTVFGSALLSSAALLELSLTAAQRVGLASVVELKPERPVLLPAHGSLQLQLSMSGLDDAGCRTLTIHARPEGGAVPSAWTHAASARLSGAEETAAQALPELASWPPEGAEEVDVGGVYEALAAAGVSPGEQTASLHALYQRGDECFADVRLPERVAPQASSYGLHPALVEALVQVLAFRAEQPLTVLSWQGVALYVQGCSALRVRVLQRNADEVSVLLADEHGEPVGQITALRTAPLTAADVRGAAPRRGQLYRVEWTAACESGQARARTWAALGKLHPKLQEPPSHYEDWAQLCAALDGGQPVPEAVVLACSSEAAADADLANRARQATLRALELLQAWLSDPRLSGSELIVLTQRAVCAGQADDVTDLAHAPLWGMLRAAQSEYPDRVLKLIDWDESDASSAALVSALGSGERQLALRQGELLAPRLSPVTRSESVAVPPLSAAGTVLISGGTGVLGALLARHLVARYGVKHLLLCSRTGRADGLQRELSAQGAEVRVLTCDVSEREQVAALLASIPAQHPLCAVFHVARALDDAIVTAQSAARIERAFEPKLDGAWHLHELTRTCPLQAFVLFSSLAATIGAPGQANYSAANAFLDALAHHRRAQGLPATALGWGLWSDADDTTSAEDTARAGRGWIEALSAAESLQLMDTALCSTDAQLLPVCIGAWLHRMPSELLPALLRPLLRGATTRRVSAAAPTAALLRARLKQTPVAEREQVMLDAVLGAVSSVLRVAKAKLDPDQPLQELGMDSLNALQLRALLVSMTGLTLSATLLFECNTPRAFVKRFGPALLNDSPATLPQVSVALGTTHTPLVTMVRAALQAASAESALATRAHVWRFLDSATDMRRELARNVSDPTLVSNAYPLSRGASDPVLICIPGIMPPTGPGQYLRFAAALQGTREVWVLSNPGWAVDELLPLSRESLLASLGRAALQCAGGRPFALCGWSSGGWIAHALATWLEENEVGPEAVVLVDAHVLSDAYLAIDPSTGLSRIRRVLGLPGSAGNTSPDPSCDEELTAWIQYQEVFASWRPTNIAAKTLMLLPTEQMVGEDGQKIPLNEGGLTDNDDIVQVAGDHMSMMIEHADGSARAIEGWLTKHVSTDIAANKSNRPAAAE
jgi:thioesterase domain-containing protein/acyl carrier protein